jgi:vacuolar-type H+-ATPase subunit I/STV1
VPKDRHKDDRKFQCWLKDNEIARFDRLPQLDGCKTDHERLLKLMEMAETKNEDAGELHSTITTLRTQIAKLLDDARNRVDEDKEVKELRNRLEDAELQIKKYELGHKPKAEPLSLKEPLDKLEKSFDKLNMMLPIIIEVTTEINALIPNFKSDSQNPI